MKRRLLMLGVAVVFALSTATVASAHTPIFGCFLDGEDYIVCEGGFSDGSSAAGVPIRVVDEEGEILIEGEMDEFSMFEFEEPEVPFTVIFDGGPGHIVEIDGEDIH